MKNIAAYLRSLLCVVLLLSVSNGLYANHLVGMDMFYTHISGDTYKITLVAYGNCGSAGSGSAYDGLPTCMPYVYVYNGDVLQDELTLTIEAPSAGVEITPVCPADLLLTQCTNVAYTIPGIKKFVYSTTYTVSGPSQFWRFLFTGQIGGAGGGFIAGRALSITNISSTPDTYIQLIDTLNNLTSPNNSPNLTIVPTPFFCEFNSDNYNPGAIDADGDSLRFFLVPGINGTTTSAAGAPVTYLGAFTATAPLGVSTMTFDPTTGQITFNPNILQRALVVYNVEEFRGDTLVGTSQREMTFLVLTCTNTPASGGLTGASNGTIVDSTHFRICQNTGAFTLNINPTESTVTNNITVTYTGLPTGSTLVTTSNGTPTPHCVFSWTSTGTAPGTYTFFVTFTDNNCPLAGVNTLAYNITIDAAATIADSISTINCDGKALVTVYPTDGSPWVIKISAAPGDTVASHTAVTTATTDSLGSGSYVITVVSAAGCKSSAPFTIGTEVQPTISSTVLTQTTCLAKAHVSIIPGGLAPWTIKISDMPGDTIQVFTGVTASFIDSFGPGNYTITIFNNIGCVAYTTFTIDNPPNMVPSGTETDPTYCGATDGTIKLYHLWPGTVDTIKYTFNGTLQPPVFFTVAVDSTVTLTGLIAGLYTNITATYGNCISTPVGPLTLTNPPFTMRAVTFTNPSWCGLCDGTITLYGLHPGQLDTLNYTLGGVAQPPVVRTIAADSMIVLTGMCQGTYTNFIAKTAGVCVSPTLGPVTLVAPPFTMRALSFTNPSWCGICDGTIVLYGLHPGDIDTINYTFNGVAQAHVIVTIPADSTVHFTGMCNGTYDNFVATKAGGCTTNTLGPVTLTAPPFTIRALSKTDPDYCGICNGTITIYGIHPAEIDTVHYNYNGVPQPAIVVMIPADSQVVISNLCQGTYDQFIVSSADNCVSNTLGPIILNVPPFTISYLSYTNPTKCGYCDGVIKVHGLHPGETDSILYTFNGVQQTPVVITAGADSLATIPGLCQGVYDSFIAHNSGVCISNKLGPVNLVAPPINPAFDTIIHRSCNGDTVFFINQSTPASDLTYHWYFGDGGADVSTNPMHIYYLQGSWSAELIITNGRCFDSTRKTIVINNLVHAAFTTSPDSVACQDSTIQFFNASTGTTVSYLWSFGDGVTSTSSANPLPYHYLNSGRYEIVLAVVNYLNCKDTARKYMTIDSISAISLSASDTVICREGTVTFTGNFSSIGNIGVNWYFGIGDSVKNHNPVAFGFDSAGLYTVMVQSLYRACPMATTSRKIRVFDNPQIDLGPDTSICLGSNGILLTDDINKGNVYAHWLWNTGQSTSSIMVGQPGVYSVKVSIEGCVTTDSVWVKNDCYMDIPNVFTPNGDGANDYFYPRQYLTRGLTYFKMDIYNRWGQLIFETNTIDGRGWDGNFNNVAQPEGVYIYVIDAQFKDGQHEQHQGNITLLR